MFAGAVVSTPSIKRALAQYRPKSRPLDELSALDLKPYGGPVVQVNGQIRDQKVQGERAAILIEERHPSLDGLVSSGLIHQRLREEAGVTLFCWEAHQYHEMHQWEEVFANIDKSLDPRMWDYIRDLGKRISNAQSDSERKPLEMEYRGLVSPVLKDDEIPLAAIMERIYQDEVRSVLVDDEKLWEAQVDTFNQWYELQVQIELHYQLENLSEEEFAVLLREKQRLGQETERIGLARSEKMADHTRESMVGGRHRFSIFQSGQEHISQVADFLSKEGMGYFVIRPNGYENTDLELQDRQVDSILAD